MGAEREDNPPAAHMKKRTDPGLGPSSEEVPSAEPVDFEALSAALGPADLEAPLELGLGDEGEPDYEAGAHEEEPVEEDEVDIRAAKPTLRLEPVRIDRSEKKTQRFERASSEKATIRMERAPEGFAESSGRSSATYASAKPHALPKAREVNEDPSTPAVIVHDNDTVPSAPPKMTVKQDAPRPPSGPYVAAAASVPSSQPIPLAAMPAYLASLPKTNDTMRMQERPRRGRTPTIVVRARGPSRGQKLFAFMAMLVLFTAGGILAIMYLRPQWLGLGMPEPAAAPPTQATSQTPHRKP